jgi:superfamily II DNA or RNA helicase
MLTLHENAVNVTVVGDPEELNVLTRSFRFRPTGYFYALSYQRYKVSQGAEGWDGYIYPMQRLASSTAKILRGRKNDLIEAARRAGFELNLEHLLEYPFANLELDDIRPDLVVADYELDLWQRQCICDWLKAGIGVNKVTVGGGKTVIFAGAASFIKERYPEARFLYLTQAERLTRQTTSEMRKFLPHFEIGQFGGGSKQADAKDMVICTTAMLNRHFKSLKQKRWFDTFLAVLFDEAHHCGSKTNKKILLSIPAYFRLGASDSEKETDPVRYNEIRGLLGPRLNDIEAAPLIESGRLAHPCIYFVDLDSWHNRFRDIQYRPAKHSPAFVLIESVWKKARYLSPVYLRGENGEVQTRKIKTAEQDVDGRWIMADEPITVPGLHLMEIDGKECEINSRWCLLERMYDRAIVQFKSRNDLIVDWTLHFHAQNLATVIVATRTVHVYILEALLRSKLDEKNIRVLIGEHTPAYRDEVFAWFKAHPGAILITPLIKEGISINEIAAMVVADHVSDYEVARQIIGRAIRPKKKTANRAHIVWFCDRQHPILRRSCAKLFERLRQTKGFDFRHPCGSPTNAVL